MNQDGEIVSLGNRMNEPLETPTSELGQRVPGSFPADDVGARNTESHRNKLHKPNDPRGWPDAGREQLGHQPVDSGVGLKDTAESSRPRDPGPAVGGGYYEAKAGSSYTPAAQAIGGHTETKDTHLPTQGDETSRIASSKNIGPDLAGHATHSGGVGTDNELLALQSRGDQHPAAHEQMNLPATGTTNPTGSSTEEASWGAPRGAGIYNTVTGHGSPEDFEPHRGTKATPGSTSDSQIETTDPAPVGSRQFMLRPETGAAVSGHEAEHADQSQHHERDRAAAGIAAGTAGLAGHELAHDRIHRDDKGNTTHDNFGQRREAESMTGTAPIGATRGDDQHTQPHSQEHRDALEEPKEKRESKLAGLFHRDHRTDDNEAAEKAKKAQQKAEHDAKKAQHDAEKAEHKEAKKEAKRADKEAKQAAQAAEDEARSQAQHQREHEAGEAAAAAAAASAAATYAAHQAANPNDRDQRGVGEEERESSSPKSEKGSKLRAFFHRSSKSDKTDDGEHGQEDNTHTLSKRHGHERDLAAASAGAYGASKLGPEHQKSSPPETAPTSSTATQGPVTHGADTAGHAQHKDHSRAAAIAATGLGAGGAAGYYASTRDHGDENNRADADARRAGERDHAKPLVAGIGAGGNRSADGHRDNNTREGGISAAPGQADSTGARSFDHRATPSARGHESASHPTPASAPRSTEQDPSHGGMYNVLPSGTPSGINSGTSSQGHESTASTGQPVSAGAPRSTENHPSHGTTYNVLPTGTPSGISSGISGKGDESAANASHPGSTSAPHSTENDPSQGGLYNILPSGTPSGINPDYGKTRDANIGPTSTLGHRGAEDRAYAEPTATQGHRSVEDRAKGPAVAAAGAGLGAAAYEHSRAGQKHPSEFERTAQTEGNHQNQSQGSPGIAASGAAAPGATAPVTGSKNVVHKCHKCGEENDISSYFAN